MREVRVVLIGGTSNVGKTSLARAMAASLGWTCVSTDSIGRHPGRPWPADGRPVPDHVARHYRSLSVADLTAAQLAHYERMWPLITSLIDAHAGDDQASRLILEGSGIWPDRVAGLGGVGVAAIWLTASPATVRARIHAASRYAERTHGERILVDAFIGRTELYDEQMVAAVRRLGLPLLDVDAVSSLDALADRCLRLLD